MLLSPPQLPSQLQMAQRGRDQIPPTQPHRLSWREGRRHRFQRGEETQENDQLADLETSPDRLATLPPKHRLLGQHCPQLRVEIHHAYHYPQHGLQKH